MRTFDVVVHGATPAGIALAVRAAREGATVLLVNRLAHLGGMLASGLGVWDTRYEGRRAPFYDEVRAAILEYYRVTYGAGSSAYRDALPGAQGHTNGRFEARVAERILTERVTAERNLTLRTGAVPVAVDRHGAALRTISFQTAGGGVFTVAARVFAECSYEADIFPLAGIAYRVGREAQGEYGEPHAGEIYTAERPRGDETAPDPSTRRLRHFPGGDFRLPDSSGVADGHVQGGNYRTLLSADPANQVPIPRPATYDAARASALELTEGIGPLPHAKRGLNRPQLPGLMAAYVEGDWTERQRIMDAHWEATLAALWFHQHDPSVPPAQQRYWRQFGLARDEFADHGHRPYEFYLREGRRLVGRKVLTQHDVLPAALHARAPLHADAVAMTEWYVDVHAVTARRVPGSNLEGRMLLHRETRPGQVPYGALLPREVDNLLVPVNLSASHVAWNAVRLEPTWMQLGEGAAFAALQALESGCVPAEIDATRLVRTLAARQFALGYFNDVESGADAAETAAAEFFCTRGFFPTHDARLDAPLDAATAAAWSEAARMDVDPNEVARRVLAAERGSPLVPGVSRGAALVALWRGGDVPRPVACAAGNERANSPP